MGAESGQPQRLTDEQVSARLAAYNPGASLDRDLALLRENAGDLIAAEIAAHFGQERADRYASFYTRKVDAEWIQGIAGYGRRIYGEKGSIPAYIAARMQAASAIIEGIAERFANKPETLTACVSAFLRVKTFETDIILAQVSLLESFDAGEQRGHESEQFERRVTDLVQASTEQSKALTDRTRSTAASARGMLGKTSEVAAAAARSPHPSVRSPS